MNITLEMYFYLSVFCTPAEKHFVGILNIFPDVGVVTLIITLL